MLGQRLHCYQIEVLEKHEHWRLVTDWALDIVQKRGHQGLAGIKAAGH